MLGALAAIAMRGAALPRGRPPPSSAAMSLVLHGDDAFIQIVVKHPLGHQIILVKQDGVVHGYRNSCPHVGVGLDWGDGNCMNGPDQLICAMHGALFEAGSGLCIDGPCSGQSLQRVPVRIEDGRVVCD
jgi:nitrite reductase/ring-hydroxylating ferredoxin subunit